MPQRIVEYIAKCLKTGIFDSFFNFSKKNRTQYFFEFDERFSITEDLELLKLMGLDTATAEEAAAWLPPELLTYVPRAAQRHVTGTRSNSSTVKRNLVSSPRDRPPPHLVPRAMLGGPMSDHIMQTTSAAPASPQRNNLNRRFREALSSMADYGSSPVI